jgi:hypothetical protein
MTTTVPAMAETFSCAVQAPWARLSWAWRVLNPEYAEMVVCDSYAKDAAESAASPASTWRFMLG